MKRFLPCIILWLLVIGPSRTPAFAQRNVDSLENLLRQNQPDSVRIRILNNLNEVYYDKDQNRFSELSRQAASLTKNTTRQQSIVVAYLNWASANEIIGNYDTSILYNQKALEIYKSMSDSLGISAALNNMGITYMQMGDYSSSVYSINQAVTIDEVSMDTFNLCIDYINLADVYLRAGYVDVAESWARLGLSYAKGDAKSNQPYAAEILGLVLLEENKIDSAFHYFELAKLMGQKLNIEYIVNRSFLHYGRAFMKKNLYDSACYYFRNGTVRSEKKNLSDVFVPIKIYLSKCYLHKKRFSDALLQGAEAFSLSKRIKNKHLALESASLMAEIFDVLKMPDSVVSYLTIASHYRDTLLRQSIKGSIEAKTYTLKLQHEQQQKQLAFSSLEEQDRILTQQRLVIGFVVVILVCLVVILFLISRSNKFRTVSNVQLTLKNLELKKLNQEVNGLINTIAHDLKSPLNTIHGIFKLMEPDMKENPKMSEFIGFGNQVIGNAHEIITELLELREMEEETYPINPTSFYIDDLIHEFKLQFEGMATQKEIDLSLKFDHGIIHTDRHLLTRILDNLISNAIKFSPRKKKVDVNVTIIDENAILKIIDQGPGFHENDKEKVFGKFQKLSARPTAGESSHGLGLAIVKFLVHRLKGTIDLQSEWGHGATFIVTIPVNKL